MAKNCSQQRPYVRCWSRSWEFLLVSRSCSHKRPNRQCWSLNPESKLSPKPCIGEMRKHQCLCFQVGSAHKDPDLSPHQSSVPFQQRGRTKQVKSRLHLPNQLGSPSYQAPAASLLAAILLHSLQHLLHDTIL